MANYIFIISLLTIFIGISAPRPRVMTRRSTIECPPLRGMSVDELIERIKRPIVTAIAASRMAKEELVGRVDEEEKQVEVKWWKKVFNFIKRGYNLLTPMLVPTYDAINAVYNVWTGAEKLSTDLILTILEPLNEIGCAIESVIGPQLPEFSQQVNHLTKIRTPERILARDIEMLDNLIKMLEKLQKGALRGPKLNARRSKHIQ